MFLLTGVPGHFSRLTCVQLKKKRKLKLEKPKRESEEVKEEAVQEIQLHGIIAPFYSSTVVAHLLL